MIPIVQFDPASLAIFAETSTVSIDEEVTRLITATISGDRAAVIDNFQLLAGRANNGRALQLTSAFLHEKRHFHDFIATTYGAYRFRQFQEVYANLPAIFRAGRTVGELHLPLEVILDPVRRRVLGIDEPPAELHAIAVALAKRRREIERDREPFSSRLGTFEIGGEAQLEALAFTAQSRFVSHFGGVAAHDSFVDHVFDREQFQAKYGALVNLGVAAGIVPIRQLDGLPGRDDGVTHRAHVDGALLECAIFAALQADYLPNERAVPAGVVASSRPAERFAAIAMHLAQEHKTLCEKIDGMNWDDCWEAVDETCAKVFGFRIHEQIARDIEHNEAMLAKFRQTGNEVVIGVSEDFIELRKTMYERLEKTPARVASTEYFALSVGADVDPMVVWASSRGELGDAPEGFTRLMAYDTSTEGGQTRPWRKWWWAATARQPASAGAADAMRFVRPHLFYPVIDSYAPAAKLMLNGRKVRTLVGPELLFAEQGLAAKVGVTLRFFPGFEFPDDEIPEAMLRFMRMGGDLICDYTSRPIPQGEATVLTPWALRRYPELARYTIEHLGGHDVAYHTFVRDWTPWAVSAEMMETLRPLMRRQRPLGAFREDPLFKQQS
ncbi:MAG TPA: hypothetical protein VF702_14855 [Allosphingosinicella sp.]|jgi:hypothetical protein